MGVDFKLIREKRKEQKVKCYMSYCSVCGSGTTHKLADGCIICNEDKNDKKRRLHKK